ncbi:hypothetical protein Dsin_025529 [Dipteronia sinensis]|uniref:Uncharacterized protein n=1 Tax=Dipteronia sinensis TaxID=43782 RepID=A0AAD9ZX42_9ROSI|nr:hypothetical protein Dsin_025529 [Dipteronia sinensis]
MVRLKEHSLMQLVEFSRDCRLAFFPFAFQKNPYKLTVLNINSDGSRRGGPLHKVSAAGRSKKGEGGNEIPQLSDGNGSSSNQDSKRERLRARRRSEYLWDMATFHSKDYVPEALPSIFSLYHFLTQMLVTVKGGVISKWRREDAPQKEEEIQNNEPVADRKLTQLPSNFVKTEEVSHTISINPKWQSPRTEE